MAPSACLTIGSDVYLNTGVSIEAWHEVTVGNNVLMAPFVSIIDDDRHLVELDSIRYKGPTVVGDNVWLGRGVSVMPGVRIGDDCGIATHAVVTRGIPQNSFAGGVPARVLRKLELPDGWVRHGVPPGDQDQFGKIDPYFGVVRGGMAVLQFPYDASVWLKLAFRMQQLGPISRYLLNLVKGRALNYPVMTTFCYDLPSVLNILCDAGMNDIRVSLSSTALGRNISSMTLYAWKRQG